MERHLSEGRLAAQREANPLAQSPNLAAKAKRLADPAAPKNLAVAQMPPDQAKHLTELNDKLATSAETK